MFFYIDTDVYTLANWGPTQLTLKVKIHVLISLSAGYRNCIGQNFALCLNEEKTVIASIIHHFKLTLDVGHLLPQWLYTLFD